MNEVIIKLPIKLHKLQKEISEDSSRFRVVSCGRRWGKTVMAMYEIFKMMADVVTKHKRTARAWVVAPTFPLVKEDWLVAEQLFKDFIKRKKQTEMRMDLRWLGILEFKSAEREDEGLRGAGLDCSVVDETSRVTKKSWEQGLRPALADKLGRAIFISTPKGRNWFYDIYNLGQRNEQGFKSWQFPTYTNPYFPKEEWDVLEATTPEMVLRQEYLAQFLENEGTVFKNLSRCFRGQLEPPNPEEYHTIGLDLGKTEDFTVITVIRNSTCQVTDIYRENKVDWTVQKKLIKSVCAHYPRHILRIDSTGLGDPIADDLRRENINIQDVKFTNASKEELIEHLLIAIEQGLIGIPFCRETDFLINELMAFTYENLPSGRVRYSAPEGHHDDGVISLALAVSGVPHLLYKTQTQGKEEKKPWGTAQDWDDYYNKLDKIKKECLSDYGMPFADAVREHHGRRFRRLLRI